MVYIDARGKIQEHFGAIKADLLNTGALENVALSVTPITQFGWFNGDNYTWQGKDPSKSVLITVEGVTPEYISTLGMTIKEGRDFNANAENDLNNIIINESLARQMGNGSPLGSVITQTGSPNPDDNWKMHVVGVVEDFVFGSMYSAQAAPMIMTCNPVSYNCMTLRIKSNTDLQKAITKVETVLKAANPEYPFDYSFLDTEFDKLFKTETLIEKIAGVFGVLAVFISSLGLFALAAHTAGRRTKEIGIRKVLGATTGNLAKLLSKDFLLLVSIACLIAFPLAWVTMTNWLEAYEYRTPIYWWVFASTGIGALLITLLTGGLQTLKAARLNPTESLRTE